MYIYIHIGILLHMYMQYDLVGALSPRHSQQKKAIVSIFAASFVNRHPSGQFIIIKLQLKL